MKTNVLLLFILISHLCLGQKKSAIQKQQVDSVIAKYSPDNDFSGVIAFYQKGKKPEYFCYGYSDYTNRTLIKPDDNFYLASLAKQFTGFVLLQLIDEGKLSPNDTLGKWFPELSAAFRKVTIEQMANQTGAIHDFFSLSTNHRGINNDSVLKLIKPIDTTVYAPGLKWGYTNTHYVLLALIVEKITNKPFVEWCQQHIYKPCEMNSIGFMYQGAEAIKGYDIDSSEMEILTSTYGDGGMTGSAEDLTAFFKSASKNKKWKYLLDLGLKNGYIWDRDTTWTYGFSWFFNRDNFGKFAAGSGRGYGFLNYYRWYYEDDKAVIILSNKWDPYIREMREDLSTLLFKQ